MLGDCVILTLSNFIIVVRIRSQGLFLYCYYGNSFLSLLQVFNVGQLRRTRAKAKREQYVKGYCWEWLVYLV